MLVTLCRRYGVKTRGAGVGLGGMPLQEIWKNMWGAMRLNKEIEI